MPPTASNSSSGKAPARHAVTSHRRRDELNVTSDNDHDNNSLDLNDDSHVQQQGFADDYNNNNNSDNDNDENGYQQQQQQQKHKQQQQPQKRQSSSSTSQSGNKKRPAAASSSSSSSGPHGSCPSKKRRHQKSREDKTIAEQLYEELHQADAEEEAAQREIGEDTLVDEYEQVVLTEDKIGTDDDPRYSRTITKYDKLYFGDPKSMYFLY